MSVLFSPWQLPWSPGFTAGNNTDPAPDNHSLFLETICKENLKLELKEHRFDLVPNNLNSKPPQFLKFTPSYFQVFKPFCKRLDRKLFYTHPGGSGGITDLCPALH